MVTLTKKRVAKEVMDCCYTINFSSKHLKIEFLCFNFLHADILQLLKKKGLRYHSQHLTLINLRFIIISQQETEDQKYTGSLSFP